MHNLLYVPFKTPKAKGLALKVYVFFLVAEIAEFLCNLTTYVESVKKNTGFFVFFQIFLRHHRERAGTHAVCILPATRSLLDDPQRRPGDKGPSCLHLS